MANVRVSKEQYLAKILLVWPKITGILDGL